MTFLKGFVPFYCFRVQTFGLEFQRNLNGFFVTIFHNFFYLGDVWNLRDSWEQRGGVGGVELNHNPQEVQTGLDRLRRKMGGGEAGGQ